jgi:ferredoxin
MSCSSAAAPLQWLAKPGLQAVIDALAATGHRVVGPRIADGAIVLADISSVADLPAGWLDDQDGGTYRLQRDDAAGLFDHVVGPHSLKNFLFPAREPVATLTRDGAGWRQEPAVPDPPPLAVLGVRGCDLAALNIQDAVFLRDDTADVAYRTRRGRLFIVAVNCRRAAATCFCHSMGCGPAAGPGYDLAVTETNDRFAIEPGSAQGAALLEDVATRTTLIPCTPEEVAAIREQPRALGRWMQTRPTIPGESAPRSLDTTGIRDLLYGNLEHPRWAEVADRCLACGNCTLVCPTCFCHAVEDVPDLAGDSATLERRWASCFTLDHGRMHGGDARPTTASRYRQWLTHKLAGWIDQFGTSGCTGCGRCITWCPVGIDLTAEVAAIRAADGRP